MNTRWISGFAMSCLLVAASASAYPQVNFGSVDVAEKKITTISVTIPTARILDKIAVVTEGGADLDFAKAAGGSCAIGVSYRAKAVCTVEVAFTPRYPGLRNGAVVLRDRYEDVIGITYLHGTGLGPHAVFLPGRPTKISAGFNAPDGLAVDSNGSYYVAQNLFFPDPYSGDSAVYGGVAKGTSWIGQEWVDPTSVAVDGAGNIFVSDFIGGIWKLTLHSDKSYTQSLVVSGGSCVAVDADGNLYTVESGTDVYKETLQQDGSYLPTKLATGFITPTAVAVDASGHIFVTDAGNPFISGTPAKAGVYKLTLSKGKYVRSFVGTGWTQPSGIAADGFGNVYINDSGNILKEKLEVDGNYAQSTVVSKVAYTGGVAVDDAGNVYYTEYSGIGDYGLRSYSVVRLDFGHTSSINFGTAKRGASSNAGPQTVTIANDGNKPLSFSEVKYPVDFPESRSGSSDCTLRTSLLQGQSCTITPSFTPQARMGALKAISLSEQVELVSNTLNSETQQTIGVSGTEVSPGPVALIKP